MNEGQIIPGLLALGQSLSSRLPLDARLTDLCRATVELLGCDRSSLFLWEEGVFRAAVNHGNAPDIVALFPNHRVSLKDPLIARAMETRSFVIVNDAQRSPLMNSRTAAAARIRSIVVAPLLDERQQPLGFLTAEYNENLGSFTELASQLVLGFAKLAEIVLATDRHDAERQRAQEDLLANEERFRALVENDVGAIALVSRDGTVRDAIPTKPILGGIAEEVVGRNIAERVHPDDVVHVKAAFAEALRDPGRSASVLARARHRDGSWRWLKGMIRNQLDNPQVAALVVNAEDVTERKVAEDALRSSEERYRRLAENVYDLIGEVSLDGILRYVSPNHKVVLGYDPAELVGRPVFDFVHADDLASVRAALRGQSGGTTFRFRHRSGQWRWLEGRGRAFRTSAGERLGVVICRDVTDRMRIDAELQRANRALRALSQCNIAVVRAAEETALFRDVCQIIVDVGAYRLAWVGLVEQDAATRVRPVAWAGDEAGDLASVIVSWEEGEWGRRPEGVALRTGESQVVNDILTDVAFQPWRAEAAKRGYASAIAIPLLEGGRPFGLLSIYSADANAFDAEETSLLGELASDLSYGIASLRARDEHRRSEAMRREEAQVASALAHVGRELMTALPADDLLERLCRAVTEVLPCDFSDTVLWDAEQRAHVTVASHGNPLEVAELVSGLQLPDEAVGDLRERLRGVEVLQARVSPAGPPAAKLFHQRGGTIALVIPLREGGELVGFQVAGCRGRQERFGAADLRIAGGVGQLASMALAHRRALEALQRANRLKSDFVATVSHELRTPLNIIMGYNDLLIDRAFGPLSHEQADALERAQQSAEELLALIEATLDLGRLETGRSPVSLDDVDVRQLLAELVPHPGPISEKPAVTIVWAVAPEVPLLHTDAAKLKLVVKNLVSNAVKFTETGTIAIDVCPRGEGVEFAVADTGIGIAPEVLPVIFEPFRQGESPLTRRFSGVGLGLYIVVRLLDLLGGTVAVDSEVGRGSTFRVWLPLGAPKARSGDLA